MTDSLLKKSQATIFIIIAVVLIAIALLFIFINRGTFGTSRIDPYFLQPEVKPVVDNLNDYIIDCAKGVSEDSIEIIGMQGGYYRPPAEFFDLGWIFIPYYYDQGDFLMPSDIEIEEQLSDYVDENIIKCLDLYEQDDFLLEYDNAKSVVSIRSGEVDFNIDLRITVKKEDNRMIVDLSDKPVSVKSRFYEAIEVARYITDSHRDDPEMICISCVTEMAEDRGLVIDMLDFDEETSTLTVISEETPINPDKPLVFEFLNRYSG